MSKKKNQNPQASAGEAEAAEPVYIIYARAGGIVGQIDVAPSGVFKGADEVHGAGEYLVPEVECTVHVKQE